MFGNVSFKFCKEYCIPLRGTKKLQLQRVAFFLVRNGAVQEGVLLLLCRE